MILRGSPSGSHLRMTCLCMFFYRHWVCYVACYVTKEIAAPSPIPTPRAYGASLYGMYKNLHSFFANSPAYSTPIRGVLFIRFSGMTTPLSSIQSPVFCIAGRALKRLSIPNFFVSLPGPSTSSTPRMSTAAGYPSFPVTTLSIRYIP